MFSRLFKPRWQHQNANVRLQGVMELSPLDADQLRCLEQLARGDASAAVRAGAAAKLTNLSLLDQLIQHDTDAAVRESASDQVMALLAGQAEGSPDAANRLRLVSLTENAAVLAHVARHATDTDCRLSALARLDDDDLRLQLALDAPELSVRRAAAEGLSCMTHLRQLSRQARDKSVAQTARDRLRQRQAEQKAAQETAEKIRRLEDGVEQLASHTDDPLLAARTDQFLRQRDALADALDADTRARIDARLGQCQQVLTQAAAQQAAEQARAQALEELHTAVNTLDSLARDNEAPWYANGTLRAALSMQQRRWENAATEVTPPASLLQAYNAQVAAWQQRLDSEPAAATTDAGESPDQPGAPTQPTQHPDTGKWLRQLDGALAGRNLKRANRLWHVLHDKNPTPDRALTNRLAARQPRLDELRDWHRFAAEPKKDVLCEKMEALAQAPLPAEEQASAIAALQDEWKALMSADPEQDENLWARFSEAGDRAWEPCASHFAEQQREREHNLAQRQTICDTLADYLQQLDDDSADWAAVQAVRQQAPRDWHVLYPAAHDKGRSRKRFSQLLDTLDARLAEASERNSRQRQALLDAAREACQSEDTTSAARTLKQLQQQWRQAPWVLPGVYRKMNKAFRHCCDTFFNAQQQQRKEQQAQRARAQASQQTILAELDQLLTQPPADGLQAQLDDALTRLEALEAADRELTTKARQRVARYRQQLRQWQAWQAVEDALRGLPEGTADDASLDLAVALEVCCQQPSPADQESRRLRWQVETLPRAMTGGGLPDRDTLLAMLREWLEGRAHVDKNVRTRLLHCIHSLAPAP